MNRSSAILPIPPDDWPPPEAPTHVDDIELAPKPELHITLIGSALGEELRAAFAEPFLDARLASARAAQDWYYRRTGVRLLLCRTYGAGENSTVAHSIIELVELPAMARFHHELGRLLGRQLPVPPPHATLYTAGRDEGIGVSTPARLRAFTLRRVTDIP